MAVRQQADNQLDILPVRQTNQQTRAFYDRIAPYYDVLAERAERPVRQLALAELAAQQGEQILEIGFGTGHNLVELAQAVGPIGRVFGIDLSQGMLKRARRLLEERQLLGCTELRQGDALCLPYSASMMDGVLMTFTLELLDTPEIPRVLSECRRVLRPEGRMVVAGLTKDTDARLVLSLLEWLHAHLPQIVDCRPIHVRRALVEAGFTIVVAKTAHIWVPVEIAAARAALRCPTASQHENRSPPCAVRSRG